MSAFVILNMAQLRESRMSVPNTKQTVTSVENCSLERRARHRFRHRDAEFGMRCEDERHERGCLSARLTPSPD